jgi:hypothetical protein
MVIWMPVCAIMFRFFVGTHTFYSISGILTALYFGFLAKHYIATADRDAAPHDSGLLVKRSD